MLDEPEDRVKGRFLKPRKHPSKNLSLDDLEDLDDFPDGRKQSVNPAEQLLIDEVKKRRTYYRNTLADLEKYKGEARQHSEEVLKRNEARYQAARKNLAQYRKDNRPAKGSKKSEANQEEPQANPT